MNSKRILVALLISLLGCLLPSCTGDKLDGIEEQNTKQSTKDFVFSVNVQDSKKFELRTEEEAKLRGEEVDNESKLSNLTLFMFDGDTPGATCFYQSSCSFLKTENGNPVYKATVSSGQAQDLMAHKGEGRYMVLVANHDFNVKIITLGQLSDIVDDKSISTTAADGSQDISAGLPMTGQKSFSLNYETTKDLGNLPLKRSVSKISVIYPDIDIQGYHIGEVKVSLANYAPKGYLLGDRPSDPKVNYPSYVKYNDVMNPAGTQVRYPVSFYSHCVGWKNSTDQLKVLFQVKLRKDGDSQEDAKTYYYVAPINLPDNSTARNTIYRLTSKISKLGSLNPDSPFSLEGKVFVSPVNWMTGESSLIGQVYLYLQTANLNMIREEASIGLFSSSECNRPVVHDCYSEYIDDDGGYHKFSIYPGDPFFPSAEVVNGSLVIHSKTPTNYLIKNFKIEITNKDYDKSNTVGKTELRVCHYPPVVVFSERKNGAKNPTYRVRTLYTTKENNSVKIAYPVVKEIKFFTEPMHHFLPPMKKNDPNKDPKGDEISINGIKFPEPYPITMPQTKYGYTISPNFEIETKKKDYTANGKNALYYGKYCPPNDYFDVVWKWESIFYPMNKVQTEKFPNLKLNYNWFYFASPNYTTHMIPPVGDYAVLHCLQLVENGKYYNGNHQISWRIPTRAELDLIKTLVVDSQVKRTFLSKGLYWNAGAEPQDYDLTDTQLKEFIEDNSDKYGKIRAYVRCVRDIHEDNTEW